MGPIRIVDGKTYNRGEEQLFLDFVVQASIGHRGHQEKVWYKGKAQTGDTGNAEVDRAAPEVWEDC